MITQFKIFENKEVKPDVNSVSPEFWEMVKIADWKSFIDDSSDVTLLPYMTRLDAIKTRVYLKYELSQIKEFLDEYHILYMQLYDYFYTTWLNDQYSDYMPSDDGYGDLLSSIIGLGKDYVKKITKAKFIKMAKDDYYAENFCYILNVENNENEYWEIKIKADPFWGAVRKYNL